jgi:hypothetical protein
MGKLLALVLSLLAFTFEVRSQCSTRIEFSSSGKQPIAVYNLMADYSGYTKKRLVGRIAHVQYDADTGAQVIGFALELSNGIRESVDITHDDCVSSMAGVERRWLPYIIRKGNRVRVDAYITGSGGFINAKNIIVLNASVRRRRK